MHFYGAISLSLSVTIHFESSKICRNHLVLADATLSIFYEITKIEQTNKQAHKRKHTTNGMCWARVKKKTDRPKKKGKTTIFSTKKGGQKLRCQIILIKWRIWIAFKRNCTLYYNHIMHSVASPYILTSNIHSKCLAIDQFQLVVVFLFAFAFALF